MTGVVREDILSSLESIRADVEGHLAKVGRYRAFLTVERTIAELADFDDLARPLADIRDRIEGDLNRTAEYRALRAVEKIVPELSDVLAFLAERSAGAAEPAQADNVPVAGEAAGTSPAAVSSAVADAAPGTAAPDSEVFVVDADTDHGVVSAPETAAMDGVGPEPASSSPQASFVAGGVFAEDTAETDRPAAATPPATADAPAGPSGASSFTSSSVRDDTGPAPSLAYSLAQMVVMQRDDQSPTAPRSEQPESETGERPAEPVAVPVRAA